MVAVGVTTDWSSVPRPLSLYAKARVVFVAVGVAVGVPVGVNVLVPV